MNLQHIRDIKPRSRNWSVKVIVCDKTQTRISPSSPNPYKRIILMDEMEQKVTATTYGSDISTIGDKLELHQTYIISNALVTQQKSKYNIHNYPYQWTLKYFTKVRFQRHEKIDPSILNYRFASLEGLGNYIDKRILIDVLAVVIEKRRQHHKEIYGQHMLKKEYVIMNEEGAIVLLTLWNTIATSEGPLIDDPNEVLPIIRATSLAISPFQGGSLGSTSSTIIAVNPRIPEARNLYNWRERNLMNPMTGTFKLPTYQPTRNSYHTRLLEIVPIEKIITETQDTQFLVKVHSVKVLPAPRYFFVSCEYCCSSIHGIAGYLYNCPSCKKFNRPNLREKIRLRICDGTSALNIAALGEHASNITGLDASTSRDIYNKNLKFPLDYINNILHNNWFLIKLQKRNRLNRGRMESQYMLKDIRFLGSTQHNNVSQFDNELPIQEITTEQSSIIQPPPRNMNSNYHMLLYNNRWITTQGIAHEEQNQSQNEFENLSTLNLPDTLY